MKKATRTDTRRKTSFHLPADVQKQLKVVAAQQGRTMRAIVIESVQQYVDKHQR